MDKFDRKDLLATSVLVFFTLFFFFDALLSDRQLFLSESVSKAYQLGFVIADGFRNGRIPTWSPVAFTENGEVIPFLVNLKAGIFYPFHVLFVLPHPLGVYRVLVLGHFFLGGLFFYLWMRRLFVRPISALLASVTFSFSGYLVSGADVFGTLSGVIWIPLLLLFFHFALIQREVRLGLICGFILAIQFLSGNTFAFLSAVLLLGFWWATTFRNKLVEKPDFQGQRLPVILGAMAICFVSLSTVAWLPQLQWVWFHGRMPHFGFDEFEPMPLLFILEFVFPNVLHMLSGKIPMFGLYIGLVPLLFALLGIDKAWQDRKPHHIFFIAVLLVGLPGALWITKDFLLWVTVSLAGLCGMGFEHFLTICQGQIPEKNPEKHPKKHHRLETYFYLVLGCTGVFVCILAFLFIRREVLIDPFLSFFSLSEITKDVAAMRVLRVMVFSTCFVIASCVLCLRRLKISGEESFFSILILILALWEIFSFNSFWRDYEGKKHSFSFIGQMYAGNDIALYSEWTRKNDRVWVDGHHRLEKNKAVKKSLQIRGDLWERLWIEVETKGERLLVLREPFYPGWEALVNGTEQQIERVAGERGETFRGVTVPIGKSEVEFSYQPLAFQFGKYFSFSALVAFFILLLHPFSLKGIKHAFSLRGQRLD